MPETAVIEAVADPNYLFKAVDQFLRASGKVPLFNVQLVAVNTSFYCKCIKQWYSFAYDWCNGFLRYKQFYYFTGWKQNHPV